MIQFRAQAYSFPKNSSNPREWEDSAAYSVRSGRFAVADGATGSVSAGSWAEALTRGFLSSFPAWQPSGEAGRLTAIRSWLSDQALNWREEQPPATVWWARDAAQAKPASATFAGLQFSQLHGGNIVWEAVAIGDCCLFHVQNGRLGLSFPIMSEAEFGRSPHLMTAAADRLPGSLRQLQRREGLARPGDLFVLATDAAAEWLLRLDGLHSQPWGRIGFFGAAEFEALITELRADAIIRDDVTMIFAAVYPQAYH